MFIGRKKELQRLQQAHQDQRFQFFIVYGRRRVGKTRLLVEFTKDKPAIFFSADENTDTLNLQKFSQTITTYFGEEGFIPSFESWEQALRYIAQKVSTSNERLVLVIDELPYLVESNQSLLSIFQHAIDHLLQQTNLFLILCGSSISFMENEVLAHKSPLFGRKTGQLIIQPFDYLEASAFFPHYTPEEKFITYSLLGGTPQYLQQFSPRQSPEENLIAQMLDSSAALYDEPINLLRQELRNPATYNAIIEAIAMGAVTLREIAAKIHEDDAKVGKYLNTLQHLRLIDKIHPAGDDPRKSRKGRYRLKDPLFRFMYQFVYHDKSLVEQGMGQHLYNVRIKPGLATYLGRAFEEVCYQYLLRLNQQLQLPILVKSISPWWGGNPSTKQQEEIDLVGLSAEAAIYAECKYRNERMEVETLTTLQRRSQLILKSQQHYFLFSKSGFTKALQEKATGDNSIHLVTLQDLYKG